MTKKLVFSQAAFVLLARLFLAAVFFYAGFLKLENPREMASSTLEYRLVSGAWVNPLALGIPLFECNLAIMLLLGIRLRVSALGVTLLCLLFTIAIAQAWIRGVDIHCNCFGEKSETPIYLILIRDIILLGISLFVLRYSLRHSGDEKNAEG